MLEYARYGRERGLRFFCGTASVSLLHGGTILSLQLLWVTRVPASNSNILTCSVHWSPFFVLLLLCLWRVDRVLLLKKSPKTDFSTGTPEKPLRSKVPPAALVQDSWLPFNLLTSQKSCQATPQPLVSMKTCPFPSYLIAALLLDPSSGHTVGASGHEMKKITRMPRKKNEASHSEVDFFKLQRAIKLGSRQENVCRREIYKES